MMFMKEMRMQTQARQNVGRVTHSSNGEFAKSLRFGRILVDNKSLLRLLEVLP